jgi:hypothetical protein
VPTGLLATVTVPALVITDLHEHAVAVAHYGSGQHHRMDVVGDDREVSNVDGIEQPVERGPIAAGLTDSRVIDVLLTGRVCRRETLEQTEGPGPLFWPRMAPALRASAVGVPVTLCDRRRLGWARTSAEASARAPHAVVNGGDPDLAQRPFRGQN